MKRDQLTFTWEVEDGYCGGSAPQHTQVHKQDILECDTIDEAIDLVEREIEDDFRNHANPTYDTSKFRKQIEEIWGEKEAV